ncbi:MAG: polyphosphate polymerase domain-containing protein [Bacteroidaceae bacterium]|nr:polyphosphate polymerase domain-containing protein [Bacteroidaceae bacterium]
MAGKGESVMSFVDMMTDFAPVTLEEMDSVKLMNRIDSKYLTSEHVLLEVLKDAVAAGYRALETDGAKINPYDTLYYDTDSLKMFQDHHNRRLVRQKVRTRCYLTTGLSFLEIKRKNNKGRTGKKRIKIPSGDFNDFRNNTEASEYLARHSAYTKDQISPVLETLFNRITLVNPDMTERLTIDTSLYFRNHRTGVEASLKDAVIIELKQDGRAASQMKRIFLDHRVKPIRVSKYCIAVTLTDPHARCGRFRVKVRRIEKTINKKITVL